MRCALTAPVTRMGSAKQTAEYPPIANLNDVFPRKLEQNQSIQILIFVRYRCFQYSLRIKASTVGGKYLRAIQGTQSTALS